MSLYTGHILLDICQQLKHVSYQTQPPVPWPPQNSFFSNIVISTKPITLLKCELSVPPLSKSMATSVFIVHLFTLIATTLISQSLDLDKSPASGSHSWLYKGTLKIHLGLIPRNSESTDLASSFTSEPSAFLIPRTEMASIPNSAL